MLITINSTKNKVEEKKYLNIYSFLNLVSINLTSFLKKFKDISHNESY